MIWNGKEIEKLYEDKEVLVINKPAGLSVHPSDKEMKARSIEKDESDTDSLVESSNGITLADLLIEEYPKIRLVGDSFKVIDDAKEGLKEEDPLKGESYKLKPILRPGIVHRLDKDTSGVMIIAKTQKAFDFLKEQFQERSTEKIYYALVYGWLKNNKDTIDVPIGRSPKDVRLWSASRGKRGTIRDAVTVYFVIKRLLKNKKGVVEVDEEKGSTEENTYTFVKLIPKTGRTHQLRVHLKYMNHPIVGDTLYASNKINKKDKVLSSRLFLHAGSLTIILPSGKKITVEAPLPEEFQKVANV